MNGWRNAPVALLALAWAAALGAASAPPPPAPPPAPAASVPAEAAATQPAVPAKFQNGDRIDGFFTALAVRFGVMIVQPQPVEAYILKDFEMPATLEEALAVARQTLEPQGFSILQTVSAKRLVLRIMTTQEFKKAQLAESPVSYGTAGEAIDISNPDRPVTHLLPIHHVEMLDMLRRTATKDPEVSAEIAGGTEIGTNLMLTGPALKVQQAVETVAKLDQPEGGSIIVRTLQLRNLNAETMAKSLNDIFARGTAPMKAVADVRTNSIIITGPEDKVLDIMVTLVGQEARRGPVVPPPVKVPATGPR